MKCLLAFLLSVMLAMTTAEAQLVNDGAIIKIQPGVALFVSGNMENKNAGTISNDGRLEVQGNFLNTAAYTSATADDSLIMSGVGNVTLNPGSSSFSNLYINKTANTDYVTLTGSATITSNLTYNSGTLSTDPILNTYTLNAATSVPFIFSADREIIGRVRRTGWSNAGEVVFNQPNMRVITNAGIAPTEFTVNMIPEIEGGDPSLAEREVKRKFIFSQVGGTGFTTDVRFPYSGGELNTNDEQNLVPWSLPATVWTGYLTSVTRDAVNKWVSTTAIAETNIAGEWKLADPKYTFNVTAFMRGPWINSTGLMRTTLNTNAKIPLSQPYNVAPFNYTGSETVVAIPNPDIIDWVLVEFRKPVSGLPADATPATFVGRKAAFILNNGSIVDLDGVTPLSLDLNKQGDGFFVIKHRNHLAIMSNSLPSNSLGTYSNDFSILTNAYKSPFVTSQPLTILASTAPGSTMYGMWGGNTNSNNAVTTTDVSLVNGVIAGATIGKTNVYCTADANFDTNVTPVDVSIVNFSIMSFATSSASRTTGNKSHVPAENK